jgi:hypothetical protein
MQRNTVVFCRRTARRNPNRQQRSIEWSISPELVRDYNALRSLMLRLTIPYEIASSALIQ